MGLTRFGVSMEQELVEMLDELVDREGYDNRSEALRSLVKKEIVRSVPEDDTREIAGIVSLIYRYGHKRKEVPTDDFPSLRITANLQVHLHNDICQKVITLQGSGRDVTGWARSVISQKGVIGGLTIVATEEIYHFLTPESKES